jgi:hypothetical protein
MNDDQRQRTLAFRAERFRRCIADARSHVKVAHNLTGKSKRLLFGYEVLLLSARHRAVEALLYADTDESEAEADELRGVIRGLLKEARSGDA